MYFDSFVKRLSSLKVSLPTVECMIKCNDNHMYHFQHVFCLTLVIQSRNSRYHYSLFNLYYILNVNNIFL